MLSSSRAVSPSPAMSAAIASRRRPSRMASSMKGSSSTINTRMLVHARSRRISSAYRQPHKCRQHHAAFTGSMSHSEPARTAARRTRSAILAALAVVSAALIGVLGYQSLVVSSSSATSPIAAEPRAHRPHDSLHGDRHGALGEADGVVPDGVSVFDDEFPAVANLDPALLGALRQAATDAAGDGVEFYVESGWRSPEYQEQLLREAVSKYGSEEEAARWV